MVRGGAVAVGKARIEKWRAAKRRGLSRRTSEVNPSWIAYGHCLHHHDQLGQVLLLGQTVGQRSLFGIP